MIINHGTHSMWIKGTDGKLVLLKQGEVYDDGGKSINDAAINNSKKTVKKGE